jgi:hypothetical protein
MKAAIGRENALSIVLAVCVLVLAGLLFWEWEQGKLLERELLKMRKIPVTEVPAQKVLPEPQLPDAVTGFPELVSRNLFAANRRSVAPAAKGGVSAMKKGQFALVGVLITPKQRSALLRDVQTNKTEVVALVGVIRGLTLGDVEPSRVVLRQGAESEELTLNVQTGKRPGMPPAQSVVAPAQAPAVAPPPVLPASAASAPAPGRATPASQPASSPSTPAKPVEASSTPKPPSNIQDSLSKK